MTTTPFEIAQLAIQISKLYDDGIMPRDCIEDALCLLEHADDALQKAYEAYRDAEIERR